MDKTLEEIENAYWGAPSYDSYLVRTIHQLRQKKISDFEIEDLRIMIGQNVGLPILIPMAIEKLTENIFAEGDFYEGDLLKNVLTSSKAFWNTREDLKVKVIEMFEKNIDNLENLDTTDEIRSGILDAYAEFKT